ncbi:MAG TPA: regulatory protein RecX [Cytophagaceae bacterium]
MSIHKNAKTLTEKEAFIKASAFCAYQERTQNEVRARLYQYGLNMDKVEEILCMLIEENFINEERYAKSFVRGKFRLKKWGRVKIKKELKERGLSPYCIQKGMEEIDEEEYINTLTMLAEKKAEEVKEKDIFIKKQKIARYLAGKGYEQDLVWDIVNSTTQ